MAFFYLIGVEKQRTDFFLGAKAVEYFGAESD